MASRQYCIIVRVTIFVCRNELQNEVLSDESETATSAIGSFLKERRITFDLLERNGRLVLKMNGQSVASLLCILFWWAVQREEKSKPSECETFEYLRPTSPSTSSFNGTVV